MLWTCFRTPSANWSPQCCHLQQRYCNSQCNTFLKAAHMSSLIENALSKPCPEWECCICIYFGRLFYLKLLVLKVYIFISSCITYVPNPMCFYALLFEEYILWVLCLWSTVIYLWRASPWHLNLLSLERLLFYFHEVEQWHWSPVTVI